MRYFSVILMNSTRVFALKSPPCRDAERHGHDPLTAALDGHASGGAPEVLDVLAGRSEMAQVMRSLDWSGSSLGCPAAWPPALQAAVRTLLSTRHPALIFWGADAAVLYNDGLRTALEIEPPCGLGLPAREVTGEMWAVIGPQIDQVMAGGPATWNENQLIPMLRAGQREEVYWTYSFGPIDDAAAPGGVGGVMGICSVTTAVVLAERRMAAHAERQRSLFQQAPGFLAMLRGPEHRFEFANAAYLRLTGQRDVVGRTVAEALPETVEQGFVDLLDKVFHSGEAFTAKGVRFAMQERPDGPSVDAYLDFIYQPVTNEAGQVIGICVQGTDVTDLTQAIHALNTLAKVDPLTGMPNRGAMIEAIEHAIATQRRRGQPFSLLYLDLDGFKRLNDALGHGAGDQALKEAAAVIMRTRRQEDVAGRLGGDEFVMVVTGDERGALAVAERVRGELETAMRTRGWGVTTSIGTVTFDAPPESVDAALAAADAMMYAAKTAGGNRLSVACAAAGHAAFC
jgi:diguanylate cyclase (GGDEF)-like protein